ncbi:MAG: ATP-binding protein [Lewinella sp.]
MNIDYIVEQTNAGSLVQLPETALWDATTVVRQRRKSRDERSEHDLAAALSIYQSTPYQSNKGAAAGARKVKRSHGPFSLILLLLLMFQLGPRTATAQIDSLREVYGLAFEESEARPEWRALVKACNGDISCLEETAAWAWKLNPGLEPQLWEYAGDFHLNDRNLDLALQYFYRGLRLAEQGNNGYMRAILHNRIGYLYTHFETNSDSAAFHLYESIAEFEKTEDTQIWEPYYNLAYLNDQLAMRGRALEYMEKAYLNARAGGRRADYGFVLYHLLSWAIKDQRHDLLDRYFPDYTEFRAGSRSLDPQHDALLLSIQDDDAGFEALRDYEAGLNKRKPDLGPSMDIVYAVLGGGHVARGNYQEALRCFQQSLELKHYGSKSANTARTYRQIADLGRKKGDPALTVFGLENFQKIRDSLTRADYQQSISRLEVEYETQKTEAELVRSQLALSESRQQRIQLQFGGGVLALLLIGGFFFFQNRLKLQKLQAKVDQEHQERELAEVRRAAELSNLRALIEGQETERSRVAKDLHDGLGGLLTTVKAHVARIPDTKEAEALIDRACTSVRRIAHNMVPQTLAQSGLTASLGDLRDQLRVQGYEVDLEVIGEPEEKLGLPEQSILLRIAQELTHNVVKHAEAKSIFLQLFADEERMLLTVEDDGKGFNLDHARRSGGGLGLGSVEQRVDYLEGEIMYDSKVGEGTTVQVTIGENSLRSFS